MDNSSTQNVTLSEKIINAEWSVDHESILVEWSDKAMCYRWLHSKSHAMYHTLNTWYTIPVIIISTLTGTANFAQTRVPLMYQNYFAMIVGGFNILAGIITTIQQFLKITQLNEAHRVSSIAWDKFYRNIKIELAKQPEERMNVIQMIKICKEEYDRLMETSPVIPDKIIHSFKESFENFEKDLEEGIPRIIKPEICDSLISTELSRNKWFSEENIIKRKNLTATKEKQNNETINNFKLTFFNLNNREPFDEEIIDNLKDKIELSSLIKSLEQIKKQNIDRQKTELIENPNIKTYNDNRLSQRKTFE